MTRYFFPGPSSDPQPLTPGTWASDEYWGFTLTLNEDGTGNVSGLPLGTEGPYAPCTSPRNLGRNGGAERVDAPVTWEWPDAFNPETLETYVKIGSEPESLWITADGFSTEHWGKLWYFPCDPDGELVELIKLPD